jgi:ubiquinone/menaquinone biosynthesis C-methylase UbiE
MRVRPRSTKKHFATLAPVYREVRDLDTEAIYRVAEIVQTAAPDASSVTILDIGAGTGRYTEAVLAGARPPRRSLTVTCDASFEMLYSTMRVRRARLLPIRHVSGLAEDLPFAAQSIDMVLSFNAVHHFDLTRFLAELARVLRRGGVSVLYTRTPEQNRATVWGRYFPHFAERENRLRSADEWDAALHASPGFTSVRLVTLPWIIQTSLSRLVHQALTGHYSTFDFYTAQEFEDALQMFKRRLHAHFEDSFSMTVQNDHLLVVSRRT